MLSLPWRPAHTQHLVRHCATAAATSTCVANWLAPAATTQLPLHAHSQLSAAHPRYCVGNEASRTHTCRSSHIRTIHSTHYHNLCAEPHQYTTGCYTAAHRCKPDAGPAAAALPGTPLPLLDPLASLAASCAHLPRTLAPLSARSMSRALLPAAKSRCRPRPWLRRRCNTHERVCTVARPRSAWTLDHVIEGPFPCDHEAPASHPVHRKGVCNNTSARTGVPWRVTHVWTHAHIGCG